MTTYKLSFNLFGLIGLEILSVNSAMSMNPLNIYSLIVKLSNLFRALWVRLLELLQGLDRSLNLFGGFSNFFLPLVTLRLLDLLPFVG
jgi:hypothetical protein